MSRINTDVYKVCKMPRFGSRFYKFKRHTITFTNNQIFFYPVLLVLKKGAKPSHALNDSNNKSAGARPKQMKLILALLYFLLCLWQGNTFLPLIFASPVFIRGFTNFISTKEQHLSNAFISINFSW